MNMIRILRGFFVGIVILQSSYIGARYHVTVLGAGYVGLVTSAIFSNHLGVYVQCADINQERIAELQAGRVPIYEIGLQELLAAGVAQNKLIFTTDIVNACCGVDIIIIAVQTPMGDDGSADTRALDAAVETIIAHASPHTIVCLKSTVPIGTAHRIAKRLAGTTISVISNPEFLREGSAIEDFVHRNPIIVGYSNESAAVRMRALYGPLIQQGLPLILTSNVTAETIKYAWNSYSALKISYANQLALICNEIGADIFGVIAGISFSDDLLPMRAIKPGPGYGGSCFPKDTNAFTAFARNRGFDLSIIAAVIAANQVIKEHIVTMLYELCGGNVRHQRIAVLGLSFKQGTDDIRESSALVVLEHLVRDGADVYAYDPAAMSHVQKLFPTIHYAASARDAITDADAIIIMTPWPEFAALEPDEIAILVRGKRVLDARNLWDARQLRALGFEVKNLGANYEQTPRCEISYQGRVISLEEFLCDDKIGS